MMRSILHYEFEEFLRLLSEQELAENEEIKEHVANIEELLGDFF